MKAAPIPMLTDGYLLGQPFSVANLSIPVNCLFTCHCGLDENTTLPVVNSSPVTCHGCQKTYVLGYNPQNGQLQIAVMIEAETPS